MTSLPARASESRPRECARQHLRQRMPGLALAGAREFLGPPLQLDRRGLLFADAECGVLELEDETRERALRRCVRRRG